MLDLSDARVFETAVDALDVGVYLVDRHRKIVYWNRGAERISGYLRQDVTGRFCRDDILVHSDENEAILCGTDCPLAACMRDGQPKEATVYLRHRAGHRVPVHVRAVPLRDTEGSITGAAEIFEEGGSFRSRNAGKTFSADTDALMKRRNCRIATSWFRTSTANWGCSRRMGSHSAC